MLGDMDDFSLSDLAGSTAIILASCGGLISIILGSRCECDLNLCYIWRCHRKPPPDKNLDDSSDEENTITKKKDKKQKKDEKDKKQKIKIIRTRSADSVLQEAEPEPELEPLFNNP